MDGAVHTCTTPELVAALDELVTPDIVVEPAQADLRYRHVVKGDVDYYILCNEGMGTMSTTLQVAAQGATSWFDPFSLQERLATLAAPVSGATTTPRGRGSEQSDFPILQEPVAMKPLEFGLEPYTTLILRVSRF